MATVLFVCTGNLCRSPLMEHGFREALRSRGVADDDIVVRSAGTHARPGTPMHEHAQAALHGRGLDTSEFGTRRLSEEVLADVDIVLAAAREHRAAAVALRPQLVNRAFTVAELARISATVDPTELPPGSPGTRLRALVDLAASRRGETLPQRAGDDDLLDPLGGSAADFVACAESIERLLTPVVEVLTESTGRRAG